jgi:hypothetical protein
MAGGRLVAVELMRRGRVAKSSAVAHRLSNCQLRMMFGTGNRAGNHCLRASGAAAFIES